MKDKRSMTALAVLAFAVLLLGFVASAAGPNTWYVPTDFPTITDALAAASPGDTIVVSDYDETAEVFPVLVQKDDITIDGTGVSLDIGEQGSHAIFVVGAYRELNPDTDEYEATTITGVTIKGFKIDSGTADIAFLVKNAAYVTIEGNEVDSDVNLDEGIRLIDADHCTIKDNVIDSIAEIGIFLQGSDDNALIGNTVLNSGLGLFIFESDNNTDTGGTYNKNRNGGVVVNDSDGNALNDLEVWRNAGWGVRFVYADGNSLTDSEITENTWGGVELIASDDNLVEGNLVYDNGTANDGSEDAQIVITKGDKAIFTTDVFTDYNGLGDLSEFVEEKHRIEAKLDLLEFWLQDLDFEMTQIRQSIAEAIGMCEEEDGAGAIQNLIDEIEAEKRAIEEGKIYGTLTEMWDDPQTSSRQPVSFVGGSDMGDPAYNFTLDGTTNDLAEELDADTDDGGTYDGNNFGLDRDGDDGNPDTTDDNEISWSKLDLFDILIIAIRYEIFNDDDTSADSLKEKLTDLEDKGLITAQDATDLRAKLDAALGFLAQIERVKSYDTDGQNGVYPDDQSDAIDSLVEKLVKINELLDEAKTELDGGNYGTAKEKLLDAKAWVEEFMSEYWDIYWYIWDIRYKLCLVDLELPPFPEVNTNLVGKKEKPFGEISGDEITGMKNEIVAGLNDDGTAKDIRGAVNDGDKTWVNDDITVDHVGVSCSTANTISSNLIASDLQNTDRNIGLVIECPGNFILNNLFTNERVEPIDDAPAYGEFHRLDVAILLLSDENLIAYNSIEWVNNGIIRGGKWKRDDYQTEYTFDKLAEAAYWPGPGYTVSDTCGSYGADHFDSRPIVWVPVLKLTSVNLDEIGFDSDQVVKRNRLALNFFDHSGTGIDCQYAESNRIDENLFYLVSSGDIIFGPEVGAGIVIEHNDHYGGIAVKNDSGYAVNASNDYTPPDGPGHATVFGHVTPPGAEAAFACANFGTIAKFVALEDEYEGSHMTRFFPGEDAAELLPPNLAFFGFGTVVLPEEKPRHPSDIFGTCPPAGGEEEYCCEYLAGWNLISLPVDPDETDPAAVFDEVTGTLYLYSYNGGGWDTTHEGTLTEVEGPMAAYWLWLPEDTTVCVAGTALAAPQTLELGAAGWQMIGVPFNVAWGDATGVPISVTNGTVTKTLAEAVAAGWIYDTVWAYDTADNEWIKTKVSEGTTLVPCEGYWIYTYVDDLELDFTEEQGPPGPPPAPGTKSLDLKAPGNPPIPGAPPISFQAGMLEFGNYPNPITDVHTTTFAVKGAMAGLVEAVKVEIYDSSGRLVYASGEIAGTSLDWHTDNDYGEYLANGVYLYRMYAKVQGKWIVSEVKKLAIYR